MKWISSNISKEGLPPSLPESFHSVLGCFEDFNEPTIDIVCYNPDTQKWMGCLVTINGELTYSDHEVNVTHWMPLPPTPSTPGEKINEKL